MNTEPPILRDLDPLSYELCALLGDEPSNYIVLLADGVKLDFFGTPPDSPSAREIQQRFVDRLNNQSADGWWPEFFRNWHGYFCRQFNLPPTTTAKEYHPKFSWAVSVSCRGYAEYEHVAFGLFSALGDRVKVWSLSKKVDVFEVALTNRHGLHYWETGTELPRVICLAVKRLLKDLPK